ncbi:MAG: DUF4349 domain-containing protein [Oscillospiraceae bacterium]
MKTKAIISIALCALMMTACGNSSSDKSFALTADNGGMQNSAEAAEDYYYEEEYDAVVESTSSTAMTDGNEDTSTLSADKIKKEMLVYTCNMTVDVLEFDDAVAKFKESLDSYGGFVESENFTDGGSDGRWYYADMEKWRTYSATVRVPSADYESFCSNAASLGDLRSRNSSVQNVSSEYYDLSTTLEIYEAKEERYIALLAGITEDAYAVSVERELTDLQVEIAKIKTRMNDIKTDVAYSFVNIKINEVKEYTAEPIKTDTFMQRLMNTLSDTGSGFLDFLEDLLFLIIAMFPYLVLIGIIVFIVIAIVKKSKKKKALKSENKADEPVAVEPVKEEEKK